MSVNNIPHYETWKPVAKAPCKECPFRRTALPGYFGGDVSTQDYAAASHGDHNIPCHKSPGYQRGDVAKMSPCAGLAIYRNNVARAPRDPWAARAKEMQQADRETVFASRQEFVDHHEQFERKRRASGFHFQPEVRKDDLAADLNELLAQLSGDPTEQLTHPERLLRGDLSKLIRVLRTARDQLKRKTA